MSVIIYCQFVIHLYISPIFNRIFVVYHRYGNRCTFFNHHILFFTLFRVPCPSSAGASGMFVASIRDYDELLKTKPSYSPPYIHDTENGQRVSFQTWKWGGENYKLVQHIIYTRESYSNDKRSLAFIA